MRFGYLGISFKNASLFIRDKVFFTDSRKIDFMQRLQEKGISQSMVLSTCNRCEIYYIEEEGSSCDEVVRQEFITYFDEVDISHYLEKKRGEEALTYLFRVSAGMESQILGEDQILGQVKEALSVSRAIGCAGKELERFVRDAITCAKRIKSELKISDLPRSAVYVGVRQVRDTFGIEGKRVLIIGSGKMAELALKYVYEYGSESVIICSRTESHARVFVNQYENLSVIPYEKRYEIFSRVDIVISVTASPHLVLRYEKAKTNHTMCLLDLAAPRDIDVQFARDGLYQLIDLDHLHVELAENEKERARLLEEGKKMIASDVAETVKWLCLSRVDSTIEPLQKRCQEIEEDCFSYLNRKMALSNREQVLVQKTLHAALRRLLREPILTLKKLDDKAKQEQYMEVMQELFRLDGGSENGD